MIDFIQALRGSKHCGWCSLKPDNWFEKTYGENAEKQSTYKKVMWWLYLHAGLGTWRLAQWYHDRYHDTYMCVACGQPRGRRNHFCNAY